MRPGVDARSGGGFVDHRPGVEARPRVCAQPPLLGAPVSPQEVRRDPEQPGQRPVPAVAEGRAPGEGDGERLRCEFVGDVDAGATVDVAVHRVEVPVEHGHERLGGSERIHGARRVARPRLCRKLAHARSILARCGRVAFAAVDSAGAIKVQSGSGLSLTVDERAKEIERVYRERYVGFRNTFAAVTGSYDSARDAVQEAFARALRERASFRGEGPLEAWIFRIALRTALEARRNGREVPFDDALDPDVLEAERDPELAAALRSLPPRRRLIVFLRYFAGLSCYAHNGGGAASRRRSPRSSAAWVSRAGPPSASAAR